MTTHPPKVFELTNENGVGRLERDRLVDMFEDYLIATCTPNLAKRIKVAVELEMKGGGDETA